MGLLAVLVLIVSTICCSGAAAQSSSSSSCTNVLISMSPCLDYITGNSSKPSSSCCSQLKSVVRSEPQCLCQVINGGVSSSSLLGLNINRTQALALPTSCNVQTPSISRCSSSSTNSASPPDSPTASLKPGSGSKGVPSSQGGADSSNGSSIKLPLSFLSLLLLLLLLLIAATQASIFSSF